MSSSVYKVFGVDRQPLYVGASVQAAQRVGQHASKGWWAEVAVIEIEHHEDRPAALVREAQLIAELSPKYNVHPGTSRTVDELRQIDAEREQRRAGNEAREAERRRLLGPIEKPGMYRVPDLRCTNCGWTGGFVQKGCAIGDGECPACGAAALTAPEGWADLARSEREAAFAELEAFEPAGAA